VDYFAGARPAVVRESAQWRQMAFTLHRNTSSSGTQLWLFYLTSISVSETSFISSEAIILSQIRISLISTVNWSSAKKKQSETFRIWLPYYTNTSKQASLVCFRQTLSAPNSNALVEFTENLLQTQNAMTISLKLM